MNDGELPIIEHYTGGPLPPAAELEQLEKLAKGATSRLLTMAEKQQAHRHEWENRALDNHTTERKRTNFYAFAFSIAALLCAFGLGYFNQPTPAGVIGGGTIATVVTAFLVSNRDKRTDTNVASIRRAT
jgi:uncharacterized membrane protein